jgi:hypothetical protein
MRSGILISITLLCLASISVNANDFITKEAFIQQHLRAAIRVHQTYGIPVSICLAQGMLESQHGNSDLALKANNFFGMKCKDVGEVGYEKMDDEEKKSCFRIYATVAESFNDYGNRLRTKPIYESLWSLPSTDYKAWANELKKCGYATAEKYPELLISIIESQGLTKYDWDRPEHYESDAEQTLNTVAIEATNRPISDQNATEQYRISTPVAQSSEDQMETPFVQFEAPVPQEVENNSFAQDETGPRLYASPPMSHQIMIKTVDWQLPGLSIK